MKAAFLALLIALPVAAQTNSSGGDTNIGAAWEKLRDAIAKTYTVPDHLVSLTNRDGSVVTNVQVTRVDPSGLHYLFTDGTLGGGFLSFTNASDSLRELYHWDPELAKTWERLSKLKSQTDAVKQAAETQRRAALANVQRHTIQGQFHIIQKLDTGLLLNGPEVVFLVDYPGYKIAVEDESIFGALYPIGIYTYVTIGHETNHVRKATADLNVAVAYYLNASNLTARPLSK